MKVILTYNLPDELDIYKVALKAKYAYNAAEIPQMCPIEESALKELYNAINAYLLQSDHDNLLNLNKVMYKYKKHE